MCGIALQREKTTTSAWMRRDTQACVAWLQPPRRVQRARDIGMVGVKLDESMCALHILHQFVLRKSFMSRFGFLNDIGYGVGECTSFGPPACIDALLGPIGRLYYSGIDRTRFVCSTCGDCSQWAGKTNKHKSTLRSRLKEKETHPNRCISLYHPESARSMLAFSNTKNCAHLIGCLFMTNVFNQFIQIPTRRRALFLECDHDFLRCNQLIRFVEYPMYIIWHIRRTYHPESGHTKL